MLAEFLQAYTARQALRMDPMWIGAINAILLGLLLTSAYTDARYSKILNKVTFPAMIAGLLLNTLGGGSRGLWWALLGWALGMAIQWVPFMYGMAKAGDVKLLAAVGALKGWAFCLFGFLYGAALFGIMALVWLAWRGELRQVGRNLRGYGARVATTHTLGEAPAPVVTRRYIPWGVGLASGFLVALVLELTLGVPWFLARNH